MLVSGMVASDTPSYLKQDSIKPESAITASTEAAPKKSSSTETSTEVKKVNKAPSNNLNNGVETRVREYFADIPLMAEVSKCESRFRQFESDGSVFRGKINDRDVGVMQINEYYHLERAKKLGFDLYSLEGNMAYARLLYKEQGAQPWVSSSPCWKKTEVAKAVYGHEAVSSKEAMRSALIEDMIEVRNANKVEQEKNKLLAENI
jgi:hypothetical protein